MADKPTYQELEDEAFGGRQAEEALRVRNEDGNAAGIMVPSVTSPGAGKRRRRCVKARRSIAP